MGKLLLEFGGGANAQHGHRRGRRGHRGGLDGATDDHYGPGRSLEFVATFGSERFQHVGFGDIADSGSNKTYNQPPWAMFSTGINGTTIQARVANGVTSTDVDVCATCQNSPHLYRIDWLSDRVDFFIDGIMVQSIAVVVSADMRPAISDFNPNPSVAALVVDWMRMTPYAASCTYDSAIIDGSTPQADWTTGTLLADAPAGTGVTVQTRSGPTPVPDMSWSGFQPVAGSTIQSPSNRYLQYRLELTSTAAELSPAAESVEVCFDPCVPSDEVCDGADNDCDGEVDEGTGGAACDTGLLGVCGPGTQQCQSGSLNCVQNVQPQAETCNTLDDDCDGQTDENDPGGGASCSTGQPGICSTGVDHCQNGAIVCVPNATPTAEACNGLDDDCDGSTDEGDPGGGAACNTGQPGICAAGIQHCQSGALACVQTNSPAIETCNGLDDDCDGQTDEAFVDLGTSCTVGVGDCARTGTKVCRGDGTGTTCSVTPGNPAAETCDGHDNDCDGQTDEGNPGGGGACSTGQPGVCNPGTLFCQSGTLTCVRNSQPTAEVCNGVDDDCDGATDEGDPGGGGSCSTGLPGACGPGTRHCVDSHIVCQPNTSSMPEICNDLDDNCNGQIDEGNPGGGGACSTGQLGDCDAGTQQCQGGALQCVAVTGPTTELCLGGHDEDCDGQVDETPDCELCLAANTVSSAVQTKKTKVKLTTSPDRDQIQSAGTFMLPALASIAPDTEDVSLRLTDGGGFYYQVTLPPGSFLRSGSGRKFSFSDRTEAIGGMRKAKLSIGADGRTVKYSFKAQHLNEPPFASGTGSATVQVGGRCFVDTNDGCTLSGSSATCR